LNLWAFFGKTHRFADVLVQTFGRGGRAGTNFTTFLDGPVQTLDVTWFELRDLLTGGSTLGLAKFARPSRVRQI
jgi:hypothetical protein